MWLLNKLSLPALELWPWTCSRSLWGQYEKSSAWLFGSLSDPFPRCNKAHRSIHLSWPFCLSAVQPITFHVPFNFFKGVGSTDSALASDGVLDIDVTISLETTWHAMEDLVSAGLVRSIGIRYLSVICVMEIFEFACSHARVFVLWGISFSLGVFSSNYDVFLTRDCLAYSKIKPSVNQIETHPYFQRESLVKFCQKHGVAVTAHTPLGGGVANTEWFGSVSALDDPVIQVYHYEA